MKHGISISLVATGVVAMLAFSNCKKNLNAGHESLATQAYAGSANVQTVDRIDAIVKDLSQNSYSFSFEKPVPFGGITRTAYGADNYLVFADPKNLICPDWIRIRYPKIPIWKRPIFIVPTCPDMAIDVSKLLKVQEVLAKADPAQYGALSGIKLSNGGVLLASQKFANSYSNIQPDRIDALTKDLDHARFIMLGAPDASRGGAFTRNFYGYADLNSIAFKQYKLNLRDIIKPTLKGCFDPLILKAIRERLIQLNPESYRGLNVTPLTQDRSIAVLQ